MVPVFVERLEEERVISDRCYVYYPQNIDQTFLSEFAQLRRIDFAVFDEAHKLSARYDGQEVKRTGRFRLAERLGAATRHLLLMTATPHNGKEADFLVIEPDRWPPLEAILTQGIRADDDRTARDQTLFALLMGLREPAIAEVYVRGRRVQVSTTA